MATYIQYQPSGAGGTRQPSRMLTARANKSGFEDILEMIFGMGKMKKNPRREAKLFEKNSIALK